MHQDYPERSEERRGEKKVRERETGGDKKKTGTTEIRCVTRV